jgi:hypothetical protein
MFYGGNFLKEVSPIPLSRTFKVMRGCHLLDVFDNPGTTWVQPGYNLGRGGAFSSRNTR